MAYLAQPMVLWPIRFSQSSYVVRVTIGATTTDLAFPASGSLMPGRNYWMSGDGQADADGGVGGVGDLFALLKATLDSHSGPNFTTAAFNSPDFTVHLQNSASFFSVLWSHVNTTLDPTIFGFTAVDTVSAISTSSPNLPKGLWRPEQPVTLDSRERQELIGKVATAISGASRVARLAAPKKVRDLSFALLPKEKVLEEYGSATEPTGTFEYFWTNSLTYGRSLRYYPDETARSSSDYALYVTRDEGLDYQKSMLRADQYKLRWLAALFLRRAD